MGGKMSDNDKSFRSISSSSQIIPSQGHKKFNYRKDEINNSENLENQKKLRICLLLSGGKDSREVLRTLVLQEHEVFCLCIDGVQGKEKVGAQKTAAEFNVPLQIVSLSFFDEETWNPIKLIIRDIAMGWIAIQTAKSVNAKYIATGVKKADVENPKLWWLSPFLKFASMLLAIFGLKLIFPIWSKLIPSTQIKKIKLSKKLFQLCFSFLPKNIRYPFFRKFIFKIPASLGDEYCFCLAQTKEDIEAALRLLHDSYVAQGFIQPQTSGMRVILQHALPTTSLLIAKKKDKVVGTISIMRDSPLGLPMEKAFDLKLLKTHGRRIAELSSLAIHPDYRRQQGGDIFFPLTIFAALYAQRSFGVDYLVWNLYPHHADFYNAIFGSTFLKGTSNTPQDYMGAPATAIQLDLRATYDFVKKTYGHLGPELNLFEFGYQKDHPYFSFPVKSLGTINDPVMTPEFIRYFFIEKNNVLTNLTELERQVLKHYYPLSEYAEVLPSPTKKLANRNDHRWDLKMDGLLILSELNSESKIANRSVNVVILEISERGFRAHLQENIRYGSKVLIQISVPPNSIAEAQAFPIWNTNDGVYGFQIVNSNNNWDRKVVSASEALKRIAS